MVDQLRAEPVVLAEGTVEIGEGPLWDDGRGRLLWLDPLRGIVHSFDPASSRDSAVDTGEIVTSMALTRTGTLLVSLRDGFGILDERAGWVELTVPVEDDVPTNRFNDGKVDPGGRYVAGTMAMDGTPGGGTLYALEPSMVVRQMFAEVTISNGLGWTSDGRLMYFADTGLGRVDVFDYDPATGTATNRRPFVEPSHRGSGPDGLCVDEDGNVWIAIYGRGAVEAYDPAGALVATVTLPVSQATSCAFGGPDLSDLYITTGAYGMSAEARTRDGVAGSLFRCRPGVRGVSVSPFAG